MSRIYNFSAGPSILPEPVLEELAKEMVDYKGSGMSIIEMSHRGKIYSALHAEATNLLKETLGVPDNYKIMFLGGGASMQFGMLATSLLAGGKTCDFTLTGTWSKKAYEDAVRIGKVNVVFDGKKDNFSSLPDPATLKVNPGSEYLHITSNETIGGIQWQSWPNTGSMPIVCDMSSDFMSRPVPIEKFGVIYAGAQKNLGPAGVAVVIMRQDILDKCPDNVMNYMNYKIHAENESMYNTPPVFCIYVIGKVLKWAKSMGGLAGIEKLAQERSSIIYNAIDNSNGYYRSPVAKNCRSKMNIVWRLATEELENKFISEAAKQGMTELKGHRSVGGCRASVYNAMPVEGAKALAKFMAEFAKNNPAK